MKQRIGTFLLLCWIAPGFAQQHPSQILCGNEIFDHIVQERYPDLQAAFDATFEAARVQGSALAERAVLTIPVVVHVVWNNPEENLHDSIVLSQIQVLNEDFNRQNADTSNLRPLFQPVAGNAEIKFQLVEIIRVQTSELFELDLISGALLTNLKSSTAGGSDAWDTQKFLNIWVCKIQPTVIFGIPVGQILGFAFPPNGLDNWPDESSAPTQAEDGVVIDFRAFGRNNPNTMENPSGGGNLVIRGRTPVHEVGHYLGLRHIWGDGGLFGANDCNQSDGIEDTPFANAQSAFDCDLVKNTCQKIEPHYGIDVPDLVENFMDYSRESCTNMFSKGQVALMRNVLGGPRSGLINSSATANPADDAMLRIFPNPTGEHASLAFKLEENSPVSIRVLALDGRMLWQSPVQNYPSGTYRLPLDLHGAPSGILVVELRMGERRFLQKICKK